MYKNVNIRIYQKQDIYFSTSYISVSSKSLKTQIDQNQVTNWVFEGLEETKI